MAVDILTQWHQVWLSRNAPTARRRCVGYDDDRLAIDLFIATELSTVEFHDPLIRDDPDGERALGVAIAASAIDFFDPDFIDVVRGGCDGASRDGGNVWMLVITASRPLTPLARL